VPTGAAEAAMGTGAPYAAGRGAVAGRAGLKEAIVAWTGTASTTQESPDSEPMITALKGFRRAKSSGK
jgi:hypothetical protein